MRSSRCQADRKQYRLYMQQVVLNQPNLTVIEDKVSELVVVGGAVKGIKTAGGLHVASPDGHYHHRHFFRRTHPYRAADHAPAAVSAKQASIVWPNPSAIWVLRS